MSLQFKSNVPLATLLTMRLGGPAHTVVEAYTKDDIVAICDAAHKQQLELFVLGGGSNTLAHDTGFTGIILRNCLLGFDITAEDSNSITVTVGAGEILDQIVSRSVSMNLSGIEALSAIPGTAGAAPVQNVGAYGQEIADTLKFLEAYDRQQKRFVRLLASDCGFSYRHSIFRGHAAGRYIIISITLRLSKQPPQPPFYQAVQEYFDNQNISAPTPRDIRQAVTTIRAHKLPNPAILPNTGSFFKNAIVSANTFDKLHQLYPTLPHYILDDNRVKIPAGWLIEQSGLKGAVLHGIKVHDKNAVVLINQSAKGYEDLAAARREIIATVERKFGIALIQEPLEIPAA